MRLVKNKYSFFGRFTFAKHQTFQPRYGWLSRGFQEVCLNPSLFTEPDVHIQLGVGKNMAPAIRYWLEAFRLIKPTPVDKPTHVGKPTQVGLEPTALGRLLLDAQYGFDPYLELESTLWILHWNLLKLPTIASAWQFVFHHFNKLEFTEDELMVALHGWVLSNSTKPVATSSIKKDVQLILRMYNPNRSHSGTNLKQKSDLESHVDSIFEGLHLISKTRLGDQPIHRFRPPFVSKTSGLTIDLITWICLDYMATADDTRLLWNYDQLKVATGSPGRALHLTDHSLFESLDMSNHDDIRLANQAGVRQIILESPASKLCNQFLRRVYK